MSMKDFYIYNAVALMHEAALGKYIAPYAEPNPPEPPVKLTGFTQVKGRRRLSKKKRKLLKTKKQ